jgi:signal transduction histidine kinase
VRRWSPSIFTKGLLLVSVPLFFELIFGITLIYLQHDYQTKLDEQVRANQVTSHANEMWLEMTDALSSKMAAKVFGGEGHDGWVRSQPRMGQEYERLRSLLQDKPEDLDRLAQIKKLADAMLKFVDGIDSHNDGGLSIISSLRENIVVYQRTNKVLGVLNNRIREFREPWLEYSERAARETKQAEQAISRASIGGLIASVLLAAAMLMYFMRGMYGGIRQLLQNTDRLAKQQQLIPPTGEADELGQLNGSFFKMAEALEAAAKRERELSQMKDDFFQMVSHDMRTPLSSIAIGIESLLMGIKGPVPDAHKETLQNADENARHLINLISDLLELEKIQAAGGLQLNIEDVDFYTLCFEAKRVVDPIAEKAGCKIMLSHFDAAIHADPQRTLRVIVNLLGNAVKFTAAGGTIILSCEQVDDNFWQLSVKDDGPGIPPDKQSLIFDRYRQAEVKDATVKGGAGLGLAVCKSLVEAQGGQIGVDSDGKSGSRFWFRLPKVVLVTA